MDKLLQQKLNELKDKNLLRSPKGEWGEGFVNFSSNDYLGMARREEVVEAGIAAAEKFGAGAGASRLAGGNHPLYEELETALARNKGAEAATVFGSGFLANLGIIPALVGAGDVVFADKLVHACVIDGIKLSGAKLVRFLHNDVEDLRRHLSKHAHPALDAGSHEETPRRARGVRNLIVTEEIFSMDGDFAPLGELRKLADEFGCALMVDGAHSLYNKKSVADIYVGTLSKAVGCYGGYVAGSETLIRFLHNKARSLIYSTALPPFVVGSAIKSLEIIEQEKPFLKALENASYLISSLRGGEADAAIQPGLLRLARNDSTIVPIIFESEEATLAVEKKLYEAKIIVPAIRPPTVPKGTSRLRISISAAHGKSDIEKLKVVLDEFK